MGYSLTVKTCCFCINLDIGTKIIGFMTTLLSVISTALFVVPVLMLRLPPATSFFYSTAAVTSVLQVITGCLMTWGAFQKKPNLLWPWLFLSWAVCSGLLALCLGGTVALYILNVDSADEVSYVMSAYSLYALVLLYLATVVRSRRQELLSEEGSDSGKRLMRPMAVEQNIYV